MILVLVIGQTVSGSQRWLVIGSITFQPSEISKLILIITIANLISKKNIFKIKDLLSIFIHVAIPMFLIFKQPDLGTSLVFIFITIGMLLVSSLNILIILAFLSPILSVILYIMNFHLWLIYIITLICLVIYEYYLNYKKYSINKKIFFIKKIPFKSIIIFCINTLIGMFIPIIWGLLKDYQKNRLLIFLNPEKDPLGAGYHVIQSQIAIGSGGIWGKGFLHGTQTQLDFIPVQHTDFIFSVIGEEFGIIGGISLLILYTIIIWRGLYIAMKAPDEFGKLIATGITSMLVFHIFVNIGMVVGLMPVTGIPLPFISYGGTYLLINLILIGLLENISMKRLDTIF